MARKVETDIRRERKKMCGETDEVSAITVQTWIEQLLELKQDYEPRNILNLDKLELFFKALPGKGLMKKGKKIKDGKKSKQLMTVMFIVTFDRWPFRF